MTRLPARYEVIEERPGRLFARDEDADRDVVIKELTLGRLSDWKELELFERETATLRQLEHPAIPAMLDAFEGGDDSPSYYLVCERSPGRPLAELGDELDANQLLHVAREVLGALCYLQAFSPPIVHRNITPDAILVDGDDVYLIDFGSVQVELHATVGGSTMVGTSGYMAPEQLLGRATAASDLYALGAVLVRMLTGMEPTELPAERMKLRWRDRARFGDPKFLAWIDRMIEPDPAARFATAEDALRALGDQPAAGQLAIRADAILASRPSGTKVEVRRQDRKLQIDVPKPQFRRAIALIPLSAAAAAACALVVGFASGEAVVWAAFGGTAVFAIVAVAIYVDRKARGGQLVVDVDVGYRVRGPDGGFHAGSFDHVVGAETGFRGRSDALWLSTTDGMHQIGHGLTGAETAWLRDEIASFVAEHRR